MSEEPVVRDLFEKARRAASALLVLAGALAVGGSFMDWVEIDFAEPTVLLLEDGGISPRAGVEVGNGWWAVGAGGLLILLALGVVARRRSLYGWLAFLTSVVLGSIVVADYRGARGLADELMAGGGPEVDTAPGLGLTVVGIAALLGSIAGLLAVAGSPKPEDLEP